MADDEDHDIEDLTDAMADAASDLLATGLSFEEITRLLRNELDARDEMVG